MKRMRILALALLAGSALMLNACGGDGGEGGNGVPTAPTLPPAAPGAVDRIEPLDTATLAHRLRLRAAPTAPSRLPAGVEVEQIDLGPLPPAAMPAADPGARGRRIGVRRAVTVTAQAADLAGRLHWARLADGAQVAALAYTAPGAAGLRLGLTVQALPPGAVLRFVDAAGRQTLAVTAAEVQRLLQLNAAADPTQPAATYWGPIVAGATVLLEIELPAGTPTGALRVAVPQVSQLTRSVAQAAALEQNPGIGAAASCTVNVMCVPELDAASRAVARTIFTDQGDTFLCTGTLLNDIQSSQTPYFLTAMHCIPDQATASTLETYWFFRAQDCADANTPDSRAQMVAGGAQLLQTVPLSDASFLKLLGQVPAGVVYAGSYFGSATLQDAAVAGIGNPEGDLQKVSRGAISGWGNCVWNSGDCATADAANGAMFTTRWDQGITQEGDSGSALFTQLGGTRYLVGQLHAGSSSCANPQGADFYGRFQRAFVGGVRQWLLPNS